jgi:class II flagellar assembly regulator FliX
MRVHAANAARLAGAAPAARRTGAGTFAVADAEAPRAAAATTGPRAVAGIDALLALQAIDEPGERRRRGAKRGRIALDALDDLKLGLLAGTLDGVALRKLTSAAAVLAEQSGDPGLDGILAEIELRAAVELAKFAPVQGLQDRS